jgi:histidinol-phosphate aminotransferase
MIRPRPQILTAPEAVHGAFDYGELEQHRLNPNDVIDFSVNSNPYGTPAAVRDVLSRVPLDRYPDRECIALRRAIVQSIPFTADEQVLVGNGTSELLLMVALAFIQPGDPALILAPTFSEYARVAGIMGAFIETYTAPEADKFAVDLNVVDEMIEQSQPRVVFICNPNNPTGVTLESRRLFKLAEKHPNSLFVIDEAYVNFVWDFPEEWSMETYLAPNILVLRSMTKDYALAGLRLGFALGHASIIKSLAAVRPAWNVNALAQAAGIAVLLDENHRWDTIRQLRDHRNDLIADLKQLGLRVVPSSTHYFLVNVGDATAFRRALLEHKILVRDCTSFGLPEYVRIAARKPDDNTRLIEAIQAVHQKA